MTRESLDALLQRNLPSLRAFVRLRVDPLLRAHESASDLIQSVCGEILQYADNIEYRGDTEFRHMLFVAVLNKIRKRRRYYLAEKRNPGREAGSLADGESALAAAYRDVCSPSEHAMNREMVELLEQAFDRLPDHHREVLTLAKVVGLSYRELAAKLGRTVPSVRNLLHRAMVQLAEAMVSVQGQA